MFVVRAARNWLSLMREHRISAVGGFVAGVVLFALVARIWPKQYIASATVAIDPAYTLQADGGTQLRTITEAISQATTKEQWAEIIARLGLYPKTIANGGLDQATADLASQVSIAPGSDPKLGGSVVRIAYAGRDPGIVASLVNAVAGNLTKSRRQERAMEEVNTASSPASGLIASRNQRVEKSAKKVTYTARSERSGPIAPQLANQLQVTIAEGVKMQVALNENGLALEQLHERLADLDATQKNAKSVTQPVQPVKTAEPEPSAVDPQIERLQQDLTREQQTLVQLRARYTDDYPDVVAEREKVHDLQLDLSRLAPIAPRVAKVSPPPAAIVAKPPVQASYVALREELEQQLAETEATHVQLEEGLAHNRALVAQLQARIPSTSRHSGDAQIPNPQEISQPPGIDATTQSPADEVLSGTARASAPGNSPSPADSPALVLAQGPIVTGSPFFFAGRVSWFFSIVFGLLTAWLAVWLAERSNPSIRNEGMLRNELPASAVFLGGIPRVHHEVVSN
jgi:hypothetical protein